MDCYMDRIFVEKMLTVFKPRDNDTAGHVYILQRNADVVKHDNGEITHILLHKVGLTNGVVSTTKGRVSTQIKNNRENYHILAYYRTSFHKYFEYACHRMYQDRRVVKMDSADGKTEWFLCHSNQLLAGILKIRKALYYLYGDKEGWKPENE